MNALPYWHLTRLYNKLNLGISYQAFRVKFREAANEEEFMESINRYFQKTDYISPIYDYYWWLISRYTAYRFVRDNLTKEEMDKRVVKRIKKDVNEYMYEVYGENYTPWYQKAAYLLKVAEWKTDEEINIMYNARRRKVYENFSTSDLKYIQSIAI